MANTLNIFTIAYNSMPYLVEHLDRFNKLKTPWHWTICHGAAMNVACTSWCKEQPEGLSDDGTTEYLNVLSVHPNITVISRPRWEGKIQMVNAAVRTFDRPGILMQIDSDEIWHVEQLENIVKAFKENPEVTTLQFYCLYFVGPRLVTHGINCYGNNDFEWQRAWRFHPSFYFKKHEPPVFVGLPGKIMLPPECAKRYGLVFHHYSWHCEKQVAYKEKFYGYKGALEGWKKLQAHKKFPCKLNQFFPWVDDKVEVKEII